MIDGARGTSDSALEGDLAERLRRLAFVTRRRFRGSGPGELPARERGGRTEFSGYRGYAPGEDFRDIDWNLYARHEQLFVREYRREEGVPVRVVVDASASMGTGEPSKFGFALSVAGGLGVVAVSRHHPLEVWRASDGRVDSPGRFGGPGSAVAMARHLRGWQAGGAMEFGEAVRDARGRCRAPALGFWITDGYGTARALKELGVQRTRGDDPVVILVSSPEEVEPAWDGNFRLQDVETGEGVDVAVGPAELEAYRRAHASFVEEWRRRCLTSGLRFAWLRSDLPLEEAFFRTLPRARILG